MNARDMAPAANWTGVRASTHQTQNLISLHGLVLTAPCAHALTVLLGLIFRTKQTKHTSLLSVVAVETVIAILVYVRVLVDIQVEHVSAEHAQMTVMAEGFASRRDHLLRMLVCATQTFGMLISQWAVLVIQAIADLIVVLWNVQANLMY